MPADMNAQPSWRGRWRRIAGATLAAVALAGGFGVIALLSAARDLAPPADPAANATGIATAAPAPAGTRPPPSPTSAPSRTPTPAARATIAPNPYLIRDVKIYDLNGRLAYQGDIDLKPSFERIAAGIRDPHRDDGIVFQNRERLLPIKGDRDYYREYVVRTPGMSDVGPQRLVLGKDGDGWYTPDHYESFIRIK